MLTALNLEFTMFEYALLAFASVVAGAIRGFSGFGLSAVLVSVSTLFIAPAIIVPVLFLLEVVASFGMYRSIRHDIDWRATVKLVAGLLLATPAGLWLVQYLPADTTRVILSLIVIGGSLLIFSGYRTPFGFSGIVPFIAAIFAGLASGLAGLAGLGMMMWMLATRYDLVRARATLAVVFGIAMIYSFLVASAQGLVNTNTLITALWLTPFTLAGIFFGKGMFQKISREQLRRYVLILLMALATIGLVRAIGGQ